MLKVAAISTMLMGSTTSIMAAAKTATSSATTNIIFGDDFPIANGASVIILSTIMSSCIKRLLKCKTNEWMHAINKSFQAILF